jgi:16S rRNA (cytosine967-C5)-methyltransferase
MTVAADPTMAQPSRRAGRPQRRQPDQARLAAAEILQAVCEAGAYANLSAVSRLEHPDLTALDRRFASALIYGTLSRLWTIDWILAQASHRPPEQLDPWLRAVLRLSIWQLNWSRTSPAPAVIDEAVRLADARLGHGPAGYANALLRRLTRTPIVLPAGDLALQTGLPPWLFGYLRKWLGQDEALALAMSFLQPGGQSLARINRLRAEPDRVRADLAAAGITALPGRYCPEAIRIDLAGHPVRNLSAWRDGLLTMQDEAAMLVGYAAAPKSGWQILDLCAAPGGKTTHLAELCRDNCRILAADINPGRLELVREQAVRLGLTSIACVAADAISGQVLADATDLADRGPFDLVLADVPCSGLGLLGRKPEIRLHLSHERLLAFYPIQSAMLRRAAALVRPGGVLIYSTCTINPAENIDQVRLLLTEQPAWSLEPLTDLLPPDLLTDVTLAGQAAAGYVQLLPHRHHLDGFFIARLRKGAEDAEALPL